MRTVKIQYEGIGEVEIQVATGAKALAVQALTRQLTDKEITTLEDDENDLNVMCEIVSKCTKYSKEEVFETFAPREIAEMGKIIMGDRDATKKAISLS